MFMKRGFRKLFVNQKKRCIPLLLFAIGFSMQIAGKLLPTLVVCYKANEKPKIEFLYDVCACRNECTNHSMPGHNECRSKFQSNCLDVPLIANQGTGPIHRIFFLLGAKLGPARELFAVTLPFSLFSPTPEVGLSPPQRERVGNGSYRFFQINRADSFLCRFLC
jgi:hypothetical protein